MSDKNRRPSDDKFGRRIEKLSQLIKKKGYTAVNKGDSIILKLMGNEVVVELDPKSSFGYRTSYHVENVAESNSACHEKIMDITKKVRLVKILQGENSVDFVIDACYSKPAEFVKNLSRFGEILHLAAFMFTED
ncbi:MAG: hypothetical protein II150_03395 [Thermoguttaceae bacterium]|nr:hypothetical protein [Thermoguttaceae bacterium]